MYRLKISRVVNVLAVSVMLGMALGALTAVTGPAAWAAGEPAPDAVTTTDPSIPLDELEWRLKPLTVDELEVEADAWQALLKANLEGISQAQIEVLEKKAAEADEREDTAETPEQPRAQDTEKAGAENGGEEEKDTLLEKINKMREQRTALIDRNQVVIDAYEAKGGAEDKVALYRKYVDASGGIKVDVSDTSAVWAAAKGWVLSSEGGLRWLRNLVVFVVIIIAFYFLSKLLAKATDKALGAVEGASTLLQQFMITMVRRVTMIVGLIVGLAALEVNISPLLAVIGAAGFVVAFALQGSLANFASGILILLFRPFDVGDFVSVAGVAGKVESVSLLSTQIKTADNKALIIPNNSVWGDVITNMTGTGQRRVDMVFGIGYDDDIDKAQKVLEDIVASHEKVLKDPEPTIRVNELADSSVNFVVRPWSTTADYWDVYWDITRQVKERFDREGISIPYPQTDVHLHGAVQEKGGATT